MHCPCRTKPGMGDQLQHYVRLLWPNKWWNKHLITMHLQPSLATARVLSFVLCGLSDVGRGGTVEDCLNIFNRSLYSWWLGRGNDDDDDGVLTPGPGPGQSIHLSSSRDHWPCSVPMLNVGEMDSLDRERWSSDPGPGKLQFVWTLTLVQHARLAHIRLAIMGV